MVEECTPDFLPEGDEAGGVAEGDGGNGMEVFIAGWALDCVVGIEGVVLLGAYDKFDGLRYASESMPIEGAVRSVQRANRRCL